MLNLHMTKSTELTSASTNQERECVCERESWTKSMCTLYDEHREIKLI